MVNIFYTIIINLLNVLLNIYLPKYIIISISITDHLGYISKLEMYSPVSFESPLFST